MPRRGWSYVAFSTPTQEMGDSERRQLLDRERFCKEAGIVLDDSLQLYDRGCSRFRGKHRLIGAFKRFLDGIKDGAVHPGDVLLVENFDRLSREQLRTAFKMFCEILEAGVHIAIGPPWHIFTEASLDNPMEIMWALMEMYRAHSESVRKRELQLAKWAKRYADLRQQKKRLTKKCPGWLRPTEGGWEFIPERRQAMLAAIDKAKGDMGAQEVCRYLETHGFKAWGNAKYRGQVRTPKWYPTWLLQVFRGREIVGEFSPKDGDPIPGYYPKLIEETEWKDLQTALDSRYQHRGRPAERGFNLFTGMVWNAENRQRLHYRGRKNKALAYLAEDGCRQICNWEDFETAFLRMISELKPGDIVPSPEQEGEAERRIKELDKERVRLNVSIASTRKLLTSCDPETRAYHEFAEALKELGMASDRVRKELECLERASLQSRPHHLDQAQTLVELWADVSEEEREEVGHRLRQALRLLIQEAWVLEQKVGGRRKLIHLRLYLHSGAKKYKCFESGPWRDDQQRLPLDLGEFDLRDWMDRGGT